MITANKKKYPRQSSIRFTLCDDIRQEVNGKVSLMGIYAADKVVLLDPKPIPEQKALAVLPSMALAFFIANAEGSLNMSVQLVPPSGAKSPVLNIGPVVAEKGRSAITGAFLRPFVVQEYGTHKVLLHLDDRKYEFSFEVVQAP
jgi:hypothetical protein